MKNRRFSPILIDSLRSIKTTFPRYLAILFMVMLGSLVFFGLISTPNNMRKTLEQPLSSSHMEHLLVSSPLGLYLEDKKLLEKMDSTNIEYQHTGDFYLEESQVIHFISLPKKIGLPSLVDGRLPEKEDEILMDAKSKKDGYYLGQIVKITKENTKEDLSLSSPMEENKLKTDRFTIVGFAYSSDYLSKDRGKTTVGIGDIDYFAFVPYQTFKKERPSQAKLILSSLENKSTYDKDYKKLETEGKNQVRELMKDRPKQLHDELFQDLNQELDDARKEVKEGWIELHDGKNELEDARKELDQGWKDYKEGEENYQEEISRAQIALEDAQKKLSSGKEELDQGWNKYQAGLKEYEAGEEKLQLSKKELDENKEKLENWARELEKAEEEIPYSLEEIASQREKLNLQQEGLVAQKEELLIQKNTLENALASLEEKKDELENRKEEIANLPLEEQEELLLEIQAALEALLKEEEDLYGKLEGLKQGLGELDLGLEQIEEGTVSLDRAEEGRKTLQEQYKELDQARQKWDQGYLQYKTGEKELLSSKESLDAAKEKLDQSQREYDQGLADYNNGKDQLVREEERGKNDLDQAYSKLLDGEKDYREGKEEYEKKKVDAEKELSDAEEKILEGQRSLDKLKIPYYTVKGRLDKLPILSFLDGANNMDVLSFIFPFCFYFIAILITLTTISRMVEEERSQIGTLKALGYSNLSISQKYLLYAGSSSLLGSILGVLLGYYVLMPIIVDAYAAELNLFIFPSYSIQIPHILIALALGLGLYLITTIISIQTTIKNRAANLMRPKKPSRGNRILLEKIPFIWNKMSFMAKVTMRNLSAKKSRMLMTLIGVAGSCALMIMGFGLKSSISSLIHKQYQEIIQYDLEVFFNPDAKEKELESLRELIEKENLSYTLVHQEFGSFKGSKQDETSCILITPLDDRFQDFHRLRNYEKKDSLTLSPNGVIVSLGVKKELAEKNLMTIKNADGFDFKLEVEDATENFVGHYIFIHKDLYEETMGKKPQANSYYIQGKENTDLNLLNKKLNKEETVYFVSSIEKKLEGTESMMNSLNIVILAIIFISTVLTFVVLFNLTNLNVSERVREISTIKVLGFSNHEVTDYIYRESILLTLFGILIGFALGKSLHYMVCSILTPSHALIDPYLTISSYVMSGGIVLFFSLLVMFVTHRGLRKIDMVEALKAAD